MYVEVGFRRWLDRPSDFLLRVSFLSKQQLFLFLSGAVKDDTAIVRKPLSQQRRRRRWTLGQGHSKSDEGEEEEEEEEDGTIGRNRGGGGVGGVRHGARLTKGGGVHDFSAKGWGGGTLFLSWEKENFEASSVKRSILTTFAATKPQKRLNLDLAISLELF
jgi:hypothetical protein